MRKRVAAKVFSRGLDLLSIENRYKDGTLDRAVDRWWHAVARGNSRWHCRGRRRMVPITIVVQPREGAVRPARSA